MNALDQVQQRILTTNNLGADLDDRLEGQRKATHELEGAAAALKQAAKKVPADIIALLDREFAEGKIKDLEATEVVALIKKYLTRVIDYLEHLGDVEQQKAVAQAGRVAGLEDALKVLKTRKDEDVAKFQRMVEAAKQIGEDGVVNEGPRTTGELARAEHGSATDRRAAEEAARQEHGTLEERRVEAQAEKTQTSTVEKPKRKRKARA